MQKQTVNNMALALTPVSIQTILRGNHMCTRFFKKFLHHSLMSSFYKLMFKKQVQHSSNVQLTIVSTE